MTSDFFDLLKRLINHKVDFVIVGSYAGVVHGCTYVTQDIDICCNFSAENLLALQKAISDLHPVHRMTPQRQQLNLTEENCAQFKNLYLDTDWGQLDCLSFINGLGHFQTVKKVCTIIETEGIKLQVLSLDALIKSKKAMNRPHDKEALLQLKTIKKTTEK